MKSEAKFKDVFVEVGGVRLRAVVEGQGESVLILHGFTGSAESMESVSDLLRAGFRVVRLELIGHGQSDAPLELEPYWMESCVNQIVKSVSSLDLGRPHLMGYSMGGRAAIAAAVSRPKLFSSLILVGATAGISDPTVRADRICSDRILADRIERTGIECFVDEWMANPIFASQACLGQAVLEESKAQRLRSSPIGLANSLRGMGAGAQLPLFDKLHRVSVPILLIAGGEDMKFQTLAHRLQEAFLEAEIEIIQGAGHAVHLEAPEAFGRVVTKFLAGVADSHAHASDQMLGVDSLEVDGR